MKEEKRIIVPDGFFVVTKPQRKKESLDSWKSHFRKQGVKVRTIQNARGEFLLCREGVEAHG
jgi:hypothetical protein